MNLVQMSRSENLPAITHIPAEGHGCDWEKEILDQVGHDLVIYSVNVSRQYPVSDV